MTDHAKKAAVLLAIAINEEKPGAYSDVFYPTSNADIIGLAQAHATLALVEQQRTANFIAWHAFVDAQGDLPDHAAELGAQIHEALGLT